MSAVFADGLAPLTDGTFAWASRYLKIMGTFSALLTLCAGNSSPTGDFLSQRPVTRSVGVLFDLCLTNRLSKQYAGDLRRYRVHYDVTVMEDSCTNIDDALTFDCVVIGEHYTCSSIYKLMKYQLSRFETPGRSCDVTLLFHVAARVFMGGGYDSVLACKAGICKRLWLKYTGRLSPDISTKWKHSIFYSSGLWWVKVSVTYMCKYIARILNLVKRCKLTFLCGEHVQVARGVTSECSQSDLYSGFL